MNDRLDEFAATKTIEGQVLTSAVMTHAAPPSLVHGAQKVMVARDEAKVLQRIRTLAQAAGDAWYYRIPYKDRRTGTTTYVEGPSIKLANDVARLYGNCDVDEWVSSEGLDYWEFSSRFIDLESGYSLTRVFRQRKNAASVGKDEARNLEIAFAIGASKAIRNAVTNALQTFSDYAYEEARGALVNTIGKDIERWRKETSERIGKMTDLKRVEALVGRPVREWLASDIAQIAALGKTIKDGMASVDDCFPPLQRQEHASTKDQLDEAVSKSKETSAPSTSEKEAVNTTASKEAADAPSGSRMTEETTSPSAASDNTRQEATDKLIGLAVNGDFDVEQRLSMLEDAAGMWEELLPTDYFQQLVKTCVGVAKGHINEKAARKVLGTFTS